MRTIETHNATTIASSQRLQVTLVPIRAFRRPKRNARTHSKKQIEQIAKSISAVGFNNPVLVDENLTILGGSGRVEAALMIGLMEVPAIIISGLREDQKRAFAIADNRIAEKAGWDRSVLIAELNELVTKLPEIGLDVSITGFEPAEIDALSIDLTDSEKEPLDELPGINDKEPVTQAGDLWQPGNHRLLCDDARNETAFQKLMGPIRASMAFADPPYNVKISKVVGRGRTKHREFPSASGEMSSSQFVEFTAEWMRLAAQYSENGSIHFCCIDWRHFGEVLAASKDIYSELKNLAVWVKSNAGQGSLYRSQHELVAVFKNGNAPHQNNVELGKHGRNRSNVWNYAGVNSFRAGRMDDLSAHPTVKPVALVADAIRDCSKRGDVILDCFMGSGTTILAAERIGRRAYGLEIDPLYVDVAIRRWQSFTGRDAILTATGQTFDEVSIRRNAPRKREFL